MSESGLGDKMKTGSSSNGTKSQGWVELQKTDKKRAPISKQNPKDVWQRWSHKVESTRRGDDIIRKHRREKTGITQNESKTLSQEKQNMTFELYGLGQDETI